MPFAPSLRWCVVMADTRPHGSLAYYWQLTAAINRQYAAAHGYGFLMARLVEADNPQPQRPHGGCTSRIASATHAVS